MAVTTNFRVEQLPFRGYDDPSLPSGAWVAHGLASGDGTGGNLEVGLLLQLSGDPLSSRLYNLEQVRAHDGAGVAQNGLMFIQNLGHLTANRPLPGRFYAFEMVLGPPGAAATAFNVLNRPIFLGAPSAAGDVAALVFRILNAAGQALVITAYGYIWEPRSILAPGGLQRPVNGLWGA